MKHNMLLHLHCYDALSARFDETNRPFLVDGWRCATNGKCAIFLQQGYAEPPSALGKVPNVSELLEDCRKAKAKNPIRASVLPPALFEREYCLYCEFVNRDTCDQCDKTGFTLSSSQRHGKVWLESGDDYYLFDLDFLHRLDSIGDMKFTVIQSSGNHSCPMGVFVFKGGYAAIMAITPGENSPPKPRVKARN